MILVAYASKHGATREIAERIAETLAAAGEEAEAKPVREAQHLDGYHAFVIGSAAYLGHWLKEAVEFVRRNEAILTHRPVWLFSSGPLGTEATDAEGRDLRETAEPKELAELREAVHPREHRVFFGALDPGKLGFRERAIRSLPAGRALLPEGDFRDWAEIEGWAAGIAQDLAHVATRGS
ncbi:MAG TPA: flavodoxin domain-containing protein [Actinomycetes bacterium]|jgi:menaquinone-dependent protoporphyrinogen oxidase|nr:flavodoxin domain-containing protein [Actinomycetes bacterium]